MSAVQDFALSLRLFSGFLDCVSKTTSHLLQLRSGKQGGLYWRGTLAICRSELTEEERPESHAIAGSKLEEEEEEVEGDDEDEEGSLTEKSQDETASPATMVQGTYEDDEESAPLSMTYEHPRRWDLSPTVTWTDLVPVFTEKHSTDRSGGQYALQHTYVYAVSYETNKKHQMLSTGIKFLTV